jgi:hypothetical protein
MATDICKALTFLQDLKRHSCSGAGQRMGLAADDLCSESGWSVADDQGYDPACLGGAGEEGGP